MWVALTPRDVSPLKKPEDDVLTGVKTSFSILAGQDTAEGIRYAPALEATLRDFIELIDNPALSDEDIQQMLSMLGFEYRRGGLEDIKNEPRNPTYTPIPPSLEILSWRLVQLACLNLPEEEIFGLPDRLLREEDPNSESAESARTDLHNPDFYTHPSQRRLQQNLQVILDYWRSRAFSILEE
jgi:hypothetical protein